MYHPGIMRYASLILIASTLSSNGCSALIARSGEHLGDLTTREKVHQKFGEPSASGTFEGKPAEGYTYPALGQPFEEFRTCRKIAEPMRSLSLGMSFVMTFGLGEVIMFPAELYRVGTRSLLGQDICFAYDSAGNVTHYRVSDEWIDPIGVSPAELDLPRPGHAVTDPETTAGPQSRDQR